MVAGYVAKIRLVHVNFLLEYERGHILIKTGQSISMLMPAQDVDDTDTCMSVNKLSDLSNQEIRKYIQDLTEIVTEMQTEWRIVATNLKQSLVFADKELARRRELDKQREIPRYLVELLSTALRGRGMKEWMNKANIKLQGRTPWECINDNDLQDVIDLLESYRM